MSDDLSDLAAGPALDKATVSCRTSELTLAAVVSLLPAYAAYPADLLPSD